MSTIADRRAEVLSAVTECNGDVWRAMDDQPSVPRQGDVWMTTQGLSASEEAFGASLEVTFMIVVILGRDLKAAVAMYETDVAQLVAYLSVTLEAAGFECTPVVLAQDNGGQINAAEITIRMVITP